MGTLRRLTKITAPILRTCCDILACMFAARVHINDCFNKVWCTRIQHRTQTTWPKHPVGYTMVIQCRGMDPGFHSSGPLGLADELSVSYYFGARGIKIILTMPIFEEYHYRDNIGGPHCPDC